MNLTQRISITDHFNLDEFFDKQTYITHDEATLRQKLNMNFIIDLEKLRIDLKVPFTINNWWSNGSFNWRGARNESSSVFSVGSMHTCRVSKAQETLRAVDFSCSIESSTVRAHIIKNHLKYPSFRRLEGAVSWVHVDIKETGIKGIKIFKP